MTAIIFCMEKHRAVQRLRMKAAQSRDIGLRIVAARKALGMTQADLCRATGLPSAQLSQWETGKHRPSLDAVMVLLVFLEVDLDYLFLGDHKALSYEKHSALQNAWEDALEEQAQSEAALSESVAKTR